MGFSHTSTPFDRVRTVAPTSATSRRDATLPAGGTFSTSARPDAASAHRSTGAALARVMALRSMSGVGGGVSFFSGATPSTTRFSSVISPLARADASAAVTVGKYVDAIRYSNSIPGIGSCSRKWRTYSLARPGLSAVPRSLYARS